MTKNVCFRLNRVRGIPICNQIKKIPSSFCVIVLCYRPSDFKFCNVKKFFCPPQKILPLISGGNKYVDYNSLVAPYIW